MVCNCKVYDKCIRRGDMYSKFNYSAGILLYMQMDNTLHVLLGKDVKYDLWSDLGGRSEETDRGDRIKTACREFFEESMGVISDEYDLRYNVKHKSICFECDTYKKNIYYMFMVDASRLVANRDVVEDFYYQQLMLGKTRSNTISKFKEKSKLGWFSVDYIIDNPILFREVFYRGLIQHIHKIRKCVFV